MVQRRGFGAACRRLERSSAFKERASASANAKVASPTTKNPFPDANQEKRTQFAGVFTFNRRNVHCVVKFCGFDLSLRKSCTHTRNLALKLRIIETRRRVPEEHVSVKHETS